ncbi:MULTISPECIES: hypothetical protein [unclassified Moorena]|uniref:hypothetical protein n=1 Tax=unclassified Moorena TaxID=2683338 RepID=UPI0013FFC3EA|nr:MULTISPECIES: hypothetical protein [unclassified Moorena]NEO15728.1 hypothetical protein [Moorena sp. SIO3E8]NEQ02175.1 hypothetical protein [Moorena sp. SIO3F7]
MDSTLLVKFLAPCLPFLLKAGNKVVEGALQTLGEDVWRKATAVWGKLQPKLEAKPLAKGAAEELANSPDDPDALDALQRQLKKLLEQEPELARDLAELLKKKPKEITEKPGAINAGGDVLVGTNDQNLNMSGDRNVNIGQARDIHLGN